jgi:hypothetical protein
MLDTSHCLNLSILHHALPCAATNLSHPSSALPSLPSFIIQSERPGTHLTGLLSQTRGNTRYAFYRGATTLGWTLVSRSLKHALTLNDRLHHLAQAHIEAVSNMWAITTLLQRLGCIALLHVIAGAACLFWACRQVGTEACYRRMACWEIFDHLGMIVSFQLKCSRGSVYPPPETYVQPPPCCTTTWTLPLTVS